MQVKSLVLILISILAAGVLATPALATQATDWTDFQTCITSASGPQWNGTTGTCTLPYYSTPYTTASTITISSASVRIVSTGSGGTVSTSPQATIQRDVSSVTSSTPTFAILAANSSTHDLVIEYLTIDGNREGVNSSSVNILLCVCPVSVSPCTYGTPVPSGSANWIDLNLSSAGYNSSPSAYHGASVQYMNFNNAPGYALALGNWGYAYSSTFQYARISSVYEYAYNLIASNTIEYNGDAAVLVDGNDVLIEYNTFTQNHDEFPYAPSGSASGAGGPFIPVGTSTNFTILGNVVDGNSVECTSNSGCTVKPVTTTSATLSCFAPYNPPMVTNGVEAHSPGGTYTDNYIYYHEAAALYAANIDGSGITSVTGAFSSTAAGQAMTVTNDTSGPFIHLNSADGVLLNYVSGGTNFGGTFLFSDLRSESNGSYGFEWTTGGTAPKAGTALNWGTGGTSAACLTGNTNGPIGTMPAGFSGPTSTSTCP